MATAPPPSYRSVVDHQQHSSFKLTFVDFVPAMLKAPGFISSPKYERFDILMARANDWLRQNPNVKVKTCESIEVKCKPNSQQDNMTTSSTFTEWGAMCYVRCLRLWVVPKSSGDSPEPQQLGYLNAVPTCTDTGGFLSNPKFEPFGDTITKLNHMLRQNPIPGKILNIETQDMKFKSWGLEVDPDKSYWYEYGKETVFYLNVIRVFYEGAPPAYEEIGCADFVPARTKQDGLFSSGDFEPLHNVVGKARAWAQSQPGVQVVNVQSMDYKLKQGWSGESLDTQRAMYYELGKGITYYVRIVRVCYVRSMRPDHGGGGIQLDMPLTLSYRTFAPCMVTTGGTFSEPQFEPQTETMKRAMAWLNATGAQILCSETVTVRMYTGHQHGNAEQTYTYNPGNRAERHMFVIRVYLDGDYQEPPQESLPPPPEIVETSGGDCCALL